MESFDLKAANYIDSYRHKHTINEVTLLGIRLYYRQNKVD